MECRSKKGCCQVEGLRGSDEGHKVLEIFTDPLELEIRESVLGEFPSQGIRRLIRIIRPLVKVFTFPFVAVPFESEGTVDQHNEISVPWVKCIPNEEVSKDKDRRRGEYQTKLVSVIPEMGYHPT